MRLTKNDMARVIVQGLHGKRDLPAADHPEVRRLERRWVEVLARHHKLAVEAILSTAKAQ